MKNTFLTALFLTGMAVSAQNITDALRYSTEDLNGTARYKAMSGAFGALGGDFSSLGINPAGSAVFSGSEIGFTIGNETIKDKNTYLSTQNDSKSSDFSFSQFGVAFSIPNYSKEAKWKKFSLAFNYQTTKNFDDRDLSFGGTTRNNNLSDYFLYYANGVQQQDLMLDEYRNKVKVGTSSLSELYDRMGSSNRAFKLRNAILGYTVGLVDPKIGRREISTSDSDQLADAILQESEYVKNVPDGTLTRQSFNILTKGDITKYNFNFATQYGDNIYLGLNLNSHRVDFYSITSHREFYETNSNIKNAFFKNELKTTGSGFSFQLGAIAKLTKELRMGLSYSSPTWYRLQDETTQYLETNNGDFFAKPNVIAVYDEYKLRTPGSWTGSLAYIFGKKGIISLDYVYKDYSNISFGSGMNDENTIIQNTLSGTSSIRVGGEYRINALSLRAGMRYEQSPYKGSSKYIGDLNGYSFGAGYSFGSIRLDVSYDIAKQDNMFQMYESVLTTPAKISSTRSNLLFTLSAKLF
ncbi:OmpP1/FadL family transporter [Capnocytophaga cynodegmi]|uniref:OmpP1/FadL family transporter n=1 Tax=Capnocytophaga cynodegmi TaxID=28189 RepID=UPI00385AA081